MGIKNHVLTISSISVSLQEHLIQRDLNKQRTSVQEVQEMQQYLPGILSWGGLSTNKDIKI